MKFYSAPAVRLLYPELDINSYISIDLSHQNTALKKIKLNSSKSLSEYINNYLKIHSKKIAFGGYLEKREIYNRSSHFNTQNTQILKINVIFTWGSTFGARPTPLFWRL